MKWFKIALAGCVSLLAMTSYAQADFIFTPLALSLFAGPLGAVLSVNAIYAGLQIAAYAAVAGAQLALSGQRQQKIDPGEMKNTFQEAETSEFNAVGRVKLGGLKAFGNTKGNVISRLIWHCKGPEVAIEQYFLGGREITVEVGGAVSSPPWAKSSGSWAHIKSKEGGGTETAWPELMTDFPNLWTPAHKCLGIFQSLVRFTVPNFSTESGNKKFQKLYQGGAPDLEVVARVSLVYDPRDPVQTADDDSTWAWSDNAILVGTHIMRTFPDLKSTDFDWAFLADEADRADALVATKTGTEKRARCWGVWPSEKARGDTMQQVLDSIGCEIVLNDAGLIRIRLIDDSPISEITFTDKQLQELNWKSGPEAVERPNICRIKYYSPERGYDMGEIDMTGIAWARIDDEVTRYGEKIFDVELPFCPSHAQAQRIARRLFLQARADAGGIKTNMSGLASWGVTYAQIEDSIEETMMLCRIASPRVDDENGTVDIPYIVWPQALIDQPWNPATMEADPPLIAPEIQYESDLDTPAAPSAATVVQYEDNTWETRVKFSTVSGGSTVEAVYRTYTGANPSSNQSMTEYNGTGLVRYGYDAVNTSGKKVDFKVRAFNSEDDGSYFSDYLTADPLNVDNTAPEVPTFSALRQSDGSGGWDITATAKTTAMNVAKLSIQFYSGLTPSWTDVETAQARPETSLTHTMNIGGPPPSITVHFRAAAYSSDGTASYSAPVSISN